MNITVFPGKLSGSIPAIASKSHVQRLLICASLADQPTDIRCSTVSDDIRAAVDCLAALGANITRSDKGYRVIPINEPADKAILPCGESGAVLRFLLPVVGALGVDASFVMHGRLSQRPLSPLLQEMERHGCKTVWLDGNRLHCGGKLRGGTYTLPGDISSQFISGLKMAFPLIQEDCMLSITGTVASKPYIQMTEDVLSLFGIHGESSKQYKSPGNATAEGDWSSAAFYISANALGSTVTVEGLWEESHQADRALTSLLPLMKDHTTLDVSDFPDLVPVLAVVAAANKGAEFKGVSRLRLKESDRISSVCAMLSALGISSESKDDSLIVYPGQFHGGIVDSFDDHRIAMAAAIAATVAQEGVTIMNADCVSKSYPDFWKDYQTLGGRYEFHLR